MRHELAYLVTTAKLLVPLSFCDLGRKAGYMNSNFFLGSNSKDGFYSFYDKFIDIADGDYLWLIKGGPGCGKSSFMQYIGEAVSAAGYEVTYILCATDPDSIDGIYIPAKKRAYIDATAPHTLDSIIPAAADSYLNLGSFYKREELFPRLNTLIELNKQQKLATTRAHSLLSAAANVDASHIAGLVTSGDHSTARRRAMGVSDREFGRTSKLGKGEEKHRFISSICAKGRVRLDDTIAQLCSRVYSLDDDFALADSYLRALIDGAWARSITSIICHDPIQPERIEALILPELSLGFVTTRAGFPEPPNVTRNIRLDAIIDKNKLGDYRNKIKSAKKLKQSITDEAIAALAEAKNIHNAIEDIYNPHVDFDGLYDLADVHIKDILKK